MDTLPHTTQTQPSSVLAPVSPVGSVAKEVAPVASTEPLHVVDVDDEPPLSPEVTHAGVRMRSDTVIIPKNVAQLGVKVVSQPAVTAAGAIPTIKLPLNDEQIAQGLHQSITSSLRWLAEWCEKRLKEFHFIVRSIGGKAVREKA